MLCVALGGWRGLRKAGHIPLPLESKRGASLSLLSSPQLEEQQTLEEAISVAAAAMQQGAVTLETSESESGC